MPEYLEEIFDRLSPALELLFLRHEVPPQQAGRIVEDVLAIYARKHRDIESPEAWILEMVTQKVLRESRP
ncbi:MAG: hypothetical protein AAF604_08590 [Acidobacteriota bacterium]